MYSKIYFRDKELDMGLLRPFAAFWFFALCFTFLMSCDEAQEQEVKTVQNTKPITTNDAAPATPPTAPVIEPVEFQIVSEKDLSMKALGDKRLSEYSSKEIENLPTMIRWQYNIVVDNSIATEQVEPTLRKLIDEKSAENNDIDEIVVFAYSDESIIEQAYDVGKAEWAPKGKWGSTTASIAKSNDRSNYEIRIDVKDNLEEYLASRNAEEEKFGFSTEERKQIFYEMVKAEDEAMKDAESAYPINPSDPGYKDGNFEKYLDKEDELRVKYTQAVLTKYRIDEDTADQISVEALQKNWPIPSIE